MEQQGWMNESQKLYTEWETADDREERQKKEREGERHAYLK